MAQELAFIEKLVKRDYPDHYDMLLVQRSIQKIRKQTLDPAVLARVDEIERAQELLEHSQQEYDLIMNPKYTYLISCDRVQALKELELELAPEELHWHQGIANMHERVKDALEFLMTPY